MVSAGNVFQAMLDSGAGSVVTKQLMENQGVLLEQQLDTEGEAETAGPPDYEEGADSSFETPCLGRKADEVTAEVPRVSGSFWSTLGVKCADAWRALRDLFGNHKV